MQTADVVNVDKARAERILGALLELARSRPGFEPGNYGSWADYRSESRAVTRDLHDCVTLASVARSYPEAIIERAELSSSDRLTIREDGETVTVDYCAGQYYPVEYRRAIARFLSGVLWRAWHEEGADTLERKQERARIFLGRRIAARWFR